MSLKKFNSHCSKVGTRNLPTGARPSFVSPRPCVPPTSPHACERAVLLFHLLNGIRHGGPGRFRLPQAVRSREWLAFIPWLGIWVQSTLAVS
jgi:hypothetical protein